MRVGIVTVQDSNNFGSFLQAYALQAVLKEMGHEVYFIRSRSKKYIKDIFYHIKPSKWDLLHFPSFIKVNWNGWKKYKRFQKEQQCFQVIDSYQDKVLDIVILGSDEIWNVRTSVFKSPIFYGEKMEKVMAYAVSIGNSTFEDMKCIPEKWIKKISPLLSRDVHTSRFLETINIKSSVVCDPTLLVDKKIFKREYESSLLNGQPYILVYSYGLSEQMVSQIREFAKKQNLRILSACFPFEWCDGVFECAALDFCAILEQAEYIFTSTFHGTIFSILNHKKFVSFPQSRKTKELLDSLGISERLISVEDCTVKKLEEKLIYKKINYVDVDNQIKKMRANSLYLLKEGLKQNEN